MKLYDFCTIVIFAIVCCHEWKIAKNSNLCHCLLPWQQSAIYLYERKWNPSCVANLHCECHELKPKVETNTSFLVLHPSTGVDTVKTVGNHLFK